MRSKSIRYSGAWWTASIGAACLLAANLVPASLETLPDRRPAFVGSGPNALINLINGKGLIERGQDHGAIMFYCLVRPNGSVVGSLVYGGTPGTEKLKFEIKNCLRQSQFVPAVYDHQRVYAYFFGTVTFSAINGKPRLRVFANQDTAELEKESDFVAPQAFIMEKRYYEPRKYPAKPWEADDVPGVVVMRESVDASGKLKDLKVIKEIPPGQKFGESALKDLRDLTFLPGFRNGRPVDSTSQVNFIFIPTGWALR